MKERRSWLLIPSPLLGPASWHPVADVLTQRGWCTAVADAEMTTTADIDHLTPWVNDLLTMNVPDDGAFTTVVAHSAACPRTPYAVEELIGKGWAVDSMILVDGRFPDGISFTESSARFGQTLDGMVRPDDYLPPWPRWWGSLVNGLVVDPIARDLVFNEARPVPRSWFDQAVPVPDLADRVAAGFLSFGPGYAESCEAARKAGWTTHQLGGDHLHQVVAPDTVAATLVDMVATMTGDAAV